MSNVNRTTRPPTDFESRRLLPYRPRPLPNPGTEAERPSYRAMDSLVRPQDLSAVFQPIVDIHTGVYLRYGSARGAVASASWSDPSTFSARCQHQFSGRLGR